MIQILKNHKWAIILSFTASIITAVPQVYLRYDIGDAYQGVEFLGIEDEEPWLSRVREVIDGHPFINNAYLKEGKNDPYLYQPMGSIIIAYLGKLFSLDINNTVLLSRFLFPFIVFLLIYSFILAFTKEKLTALATSSFLMLGNSLFARRAIFQIFGGESPSVTFLNYTRPVNPLMTHLFFFGFLLCFWLFLNTSTQLSAWKKWRWGIVSALLLGLSFYDYFYTWTFLYAFFGVLIIIFLFQKRWMDIKRAAAVLSGASILAIPYLVNLYQVTIWPTYAEAKLRFGMLEGHYPILGLTVSLLLIIFLLFFQRKWRDRYYFALALVAAPVIVLNQQLITGKIMMIDHYHWYFHLPLAAIFSLVIFFHWVAKIKQPLAILIIFISIFTALFIQKSSYAFNQEMIVDSQRYGSVLNWLSQNAEKEEVVFSDARAASFIVVYTPLNVFYHPVARQSLAATNERLENTIFLYYRLDGLGSSQAKEIFIKDKVQISHLIYGMYFREEREMPDELLWGILQRYQDSLSDSSFFEKMMDKYEVKYLVWDKRDYPFWQIDQYQFLKKVVEMGEFAIYEYKM